MQKEKQLQIRGGIEDKSKIFFLLIYKDICLDEMVLMMGHKICFNTEIWLIIPKLALLPLLIWRAENYCINLDGCCSCSISRMLKFCIKMLYVMSKVLSDELLCTQTGLVILLRGHARAPPFLFFSNGC